AVTGFGVHPVGGPGRFDGEGTVAAAGLHQVRYGAEFEVDRAVAALGAHRAGGDLRAHGSVAGARLEGTGGVGDMDRAVRRADAQRVAEALGPHAAVLVLDLDCHTAGHL